MGLNIRNGYQPCWRQALVGTLKNIPYYWYFAPKTFSLGYLFGFTFGDVHKEKNKNIFSVNQKDIHGERVYTLITFVSNSFIKVILLSAWNVHFNYLRIKGSVVFPFLWTWVHFTDEILKKKSKDGDSTSAPRILSLPVHYDNTPKKEKDMVKIVVLDPSVQFLETARGAVYNVGRSLANQFENADYLQSPSNFNYRSLTP